ncbi:nuclear transport factor 2 family protein [Draconibacterium sp.]|nr:nuclear transport factor 2 family protein [Draconibacterium sp.]
MKTILKRHVYILLILLLDVIILGCSPALESRVKTYEQAHNEHDIEEVMSLYANDITFEIVGTWKKTGKEQVSGLAEWDAATNSQMIISDIRVSNDTVTFKLKEGNDWFRLAGIEFMYYEPCTMVFKNGLIKEIRAEVTQESMLAFNEVWPSIYQWISKERNEELSGLIFEGQFVYNSENAKKWLSLLHEWRKKDKDL